MNDDSNHSKKATVYRLVLGTELLLTMLILPMPSMDAVGDFLLISMGLLFIPLVLAGAVLVAGVWLLAFVAKVIADAFVPTTRGRF